MFAYAAEGHSSAAPNVETRERICRESCCSGL